MAFNTIKLFSSLSVERKNDIISQFPIAFLAAAVNKAHANPSLSSRIGAVTAKKRKLKSRRACASKLSSFSSSSASSSSSTTSSTHSSSSSTLNDMSSSQGPSGAVTTATVELKNSYELLSDIDED